MPSRPVVLPIIVFLVTSAAASPLLALLQDRFGLDPNILRLTVFSTAVGAGLVALIWRRGIVFPRMTTTGAVQSMAVGVVLSLLAGLLAWLLSQVQGAPWRPPIVSALGAPLAVLLAVQIVGAAAEEVGWRGLVQPLLETRMAAWKAALLTGVMFAIGHFYLVFAISPVSFALFIVSAVALSLILALATVGRGWKMRVLVATALHFLVNMETFFLFADGDGSVLYFADLAAAFGVVGIAAIWFLFRRRADPAN